MKKFFLNKALRILLATNSLILIAVAMLGPIYALFVETIGGDLLDASFAGATFALAAGLTTLVSGKLSDKVKENKIIVVIGYLLMSLGFFLYTQVETMCFLLVVQIILGLGEAIYSPAFDDEFSRHLDKGKAASEWGLWESMNYFAIAVGAIIGGYIVNKFGFSTMFIVMGSLCFISATYIFFLPKKVL